MGALKTHQNKFLVIFVSDLDGLGSLAGDGLGLSNNHSDGLSGMEDVAAGENLLRGVKE